MSIDENIHSGEEREKGEGPVIMAVIYTKGIDHSSDVRGRWMSTICTIDQGAVCPSIAYGLSVDRAAVATWTGRSRIGIGPSNNNNSVARARATELPATRVEAVVVTPKLCLRFPLFLHFYRL